MHLRNFTGARWSAGPNSPGGVADQRGDWSEHQMLCYPADRLKVFATELMLRDLTGGADRIYTL